MPHHEGISASVPRVYHDRRVGALSVLLCNAAGGGMRSEFCCTDCGRHDRHLDPLLLHVPGCRIMRASQQVFLVCVCVCVCVCVMIGVLPRSATVMHSRWRRVRHIPAIADGSQETTTWGFTCSEVMTARTYDPARDIHCGQEVAIGAASRVRRVGNLPAPHVAPAGPYPRRVVNVELRRGRLCVGGGGERDEERGSV